MKFNIEFTNVVLHTRKVLSENYDWHEGVGVFKDTRIRQLLGNLVGKCEQMNGEDPKSPHTSFILLLIFR